MARILEVVARSSPYLSGTSRVAEDNGRQLALRGHAVKIASLDFVGDVNGTGAGRRSKWRFGNAGRLGSLPEPVDLVHLHLPFIGGGSQAIRFARRRNLPLIITYHQDLHGRGVVGSGFRWYVDNIIASQIERADAVIVPTMDYARHSVLRDTLSASQLHEIPNGVDTDFFVPGGKATADTFLFVGGLDKAHRFKGLQVLIAALPLTKNGARLLVIGDGGQRARFERLVARRGLSDRIRFLGRVDRHVLREHYQSSIATILPSTGPGEIFGLVLLEAMACGRPTIASNFPGVRTVVIEGRTGLLVPPGDPSGLASAIDYLMENPPKAREFGLAARERAVTFYDLNRVGARLTRLMVEVLEHRNPQARPP